MKETPQITNQTTPSHLGEGWGEGLQALASKYERKEFLVGDPSWFMHQVEGDTNRELLAFIASSISYGSRKQFLPKIQSLLDSITNFDPVHIGVSDMIISDWLTSGRYKDAVPANDECFYRLYTNRTFNTFLSALAEMVRQYGSIKQYLINNMKSNTCLEAVEWITKWFADQGSVGVIPKDTSSSCKRICMFLRWMVRDNSPVDLGIWSDIIDKRTLIIPMDTHVVQEAMNLGLLKSKSVSMASARKLSAKLAEIFPDDPIKGDFALFGLGVDEEK